MEVGVGDGGRGGGWVGGGVKHTTKIMGTKDNTANHFRIQAYEYMKCRHFLYRIY